MPTGMLAPTSLYLPTSFAAADIIAAAIGAIGDAVLILLEKGLGYPSSDGADGRGSVWRYVAIGPIGTGNPVVNRRFAQNGKFGLDLTLGCMLDYDAYFVHGTQADG